MIEKWFEAFTLMQRVPAKDGLGASPPVLAADIPFRGVLSFTTADEITAGGQPVLADKPMLLYEMDVTLTLGDRIRREKDGAIYRVCAGPMGSPAWSGLRFAQIPVERLVIPC